MSQSGIPGSLGRGASKKEPAKERFDYLNFGKDESEIESEKKSGSEENYSEIESEVKSEMSKVEPKKEEKK